MLVEFMGQKMLGSFHFTVGQKNCLLGLEKQLHHQVCETSFEYCWGGLRGREFFFSALVLVCESLLSPCIRPVFIEFPPVTDLWHD